MNVLVIEDDEGIRQIFRYMFRGTGHEVVYTENLGEAAGRLEAMGDCSLVISDYKLPDGISLEFVRELRERFPFAAVLIVTGDHAAAEEIASIGDPRTGVLTKPFVMDDAMKVILALTARASES